MKNLKWNFNEEYDQFEATFNAKLKSISEERFENVNGTPYFVVTADFEGKSITALMYEANYEKGVKIGETYSCRAVYDPEREGEDVLITMSHLTSGERLTASELGLTKDVIESAKNSAKETLKKAKESAEEYAKES